VAGIAEDCCVTQSTYTPAEAATVLRVHRKTVYAYMRRGELKAYRVGPRKRLIAASELSRFMKRASHPGAAEAQKP
jgi:excisionase family DNA binding protein